MKPRTKTNLLALLLTVACVFIGYTLYRTNGARDPLVWIPFTVGLLGILLSVVRNARSE
jgi:hypothetical protein